MGKLYSTGFVKIDQIVPLIKDVKPFYSSCQSTIQEYEKVGIRPPIIVSRNLYLLNGHKTLATIKQKTLSGTDIEVVILNRDLSLGEAGEMYEILNNRSLPMEKTTEIYVGQKQTQADLSEVIKKSHVLFRPVKAFFQAKMLIETLKGAPIDMQISLHKTINNALANTNTRSEE